MKRILSIIALAAFAAPLFGQTAADAFRFSENIYEGTARTVAMGNAFTALGGDLGSIGINPAGSAVANYSQVTITPGLTISSSTSYGNPAGETSYFEQIMKSKKTAFTLPNVAATFNLNLGNKTGLKNMTFGFAVNRTNDYGQNVFAMGTNDKTSYLGSMAYWATLDGVYAGDLTASNRWETQPWRYVIGHKTGMIATLGDDYSYIGATEDFENIGTEENPHYNIFTPGQLEQSYSRMVSGEKYEYAFNVAFNISDKLYLGVNLVGTSLSYSYEHYFKEVSVNPSDFEYDMGGKIYQFDKMKYSTFYDASGSGFYGKIGAIFTPGLGIRIGAAIQTPTVMNIRERWQERGEMSTLITSTSSSEASPEGETSYRLVSPFRANFGLAWTFGRFGVISADYEFSDYKQMRYTRSRDLDSEFLMDLNTEIRDSYATSHLFRAGVELKPLSVLALRAGYAINSPSLKSEINFKDADGRGPGTRFCKQAVSFGIGFASKSSFFADLTAQKIFYPTEYYMPYDPYVLDETNNELAGYYVPEIVIKPRQWKVMLTLGWRF